MSARILIVDDDPDILAGLKRRLEWMGHHMAAELITRIITEQVVFKPGDLAAQFQS